MGANSALIFGIIINVAILLVFFRFLMQLAAVSPYNPVVLSTIKATKIVDVFGRIFQRLAKVELTLQPWLCWWCCIYSKFLVLCISMVRCRIVQFTY